MSIMGAFFIAMNSVVKKSFQKPWLAHDAQVQKLVARGLRITDVNAARRFLSYINYYRFTGFCTFL